METHSETDGPQPGHGSSLETDHTIGAAGTTLVGKVTVSTLLGLAWPVVISRACQVVVGVTDVVMVASLGPAAIAATATGALNAFSVMIFPMGTAFIVSSFASQLAGRGDRAGARRYGIYGLLLAAATLLLSLAALPFVGTVLAWFPYAADVRALMTEYLRWRLLSCGAAVGMEALANYYGGLGRTRLPMVASVAAMVLNVGFNWIFIFGHCGMPAWGVAGAGLANSLATSVAFAFLLGTFFFEGRGLRRAGRLRLSELLRMLRFGIPSGLNWAFEFYAFNFFMNVVVAGLGTTALAAINTVMQINSVSFMPAFGLASAGAILVGQAIGADRKDDVPRLWRLTFRTTALWQCLVGLLYVAIPGVLLLAFSPSGSDGEELRRVGSGMLALSAAWQLFDAAATTLGEVLRAAGDTAFTMWARIALAWLVFAPGSLLVIRRLDGGPVGAMLCLTFYLGALALLLYLRFRAGSWRRMRLTEPAALD